MTQPTIDSEVRKFLDKFKEDTEDLWEQFMEGEDPDPQRYDDFLDNAYKDATQAITHKIAQAAAAARKDQVEHDYWAYRVMWADDIDMVESAQEIQAYLLGEIDELKGQTK